MPGIVDPMESFLTFQPALDDGLIQLQKGHCDPRTFTLLDDADGMPRYSFVHFEDETAISIAMIIPAEPYLEKPVYQLAYAVLEDYRGQGRAKKIAEAALVELGAILRGRGVGEYYLEVVVGSGNAASLKVAQSVTGVEPNEITDENSGEDALQFLSLVRV